MLAVWSERVKVLEEEEEGRVTQDEQTVPATSSEVEVQGEDKDKVAVVIGADGDGGRVGPRKSASVESGSEDAGLGMKM